MITCFFKDTILWEIYFWTFRNELFFLFSNRVFNMLFIYIFILFRPIYGQELLIRNSLIKIFLFLLTLNCDIYYLFLKMVWFNKICCGGFTKNLNLSYNAEIFVLVIILKLNFDISHRMSLNLKKLHFIIVLSSKISEKIPLVCWEYLTAINLEIFHSWREKLFIHEHHRCKLNFFL